MAKYRSKPVEVEAVPITPAILQMGGQSLLPKWAWPFVDISMRGPYGASVECHVRTRNGWVEASVGDMLIRGLTANEVYPCKPDVFAERYEPIEDTKTADRV